MAMPGGIEMKVHYRDMHAFRKHEHQLLEDGWTPGGYTVGIARGGIWRFVLRRRLLKPVDARYRRSDWPVLGHA